MHKAVFYFLCRTHLRYGQVLVPYILHAFTVIIGYHLVKVICDTFLNLYKFKVSDAI